MKRITAMILCAFMVLALLPSVGFAQQAESSGTLYAGYNKVRIDPSGHPDGEITGLPMAGAGAVTTRLSVGTLDDSGDGRVTADDGLFATCIAVTDQYDNTLLYMGVDYVHTAASWTAPAKRAIVEALSGAGYELNVNDIFMSASHTHNAPEMTYGISFTADQLAADEIAQKMNIYRTWVFEMLGQAAVAAMQDREAVTLTKGTVDISDTVKAMNPNATANQQRMNYVRHYKSMKNGQIVYGGSNFGYIGYSSIDTEMVSEPMDQMQLVQFTPKSGDKDPIVLVNWNSHPTINFTKGTDYGAASHYKISSDYINSLRLGLANEGYRAGFLQGPAATTASYTEVKHLRNTEVLDENMENRGYLYGTRLSEFALYGLKNNMSDPLDTSYVRYVSGQLTYDTNLPTAEEQALITAMLAADPSTYPSDRYSDLVTYLGTDATTWAQHGKYEETFPGLKKITSRYHLNSAKSRMSYLTTPQASLTVEAIAIGKNLAFVAAPNELSDRYSLTDTLESVTDNDWLDLIDDTYGMPLIMTCTDGRLGYIPHQLAYTYNKDSEQYAVGSYESQTSSYSRGTGEKLVAFFDKLLDQLYDDGVRIQCVCGGKIVSGQNGHMCKQVEFRPWNDPETLPASGYYYLTTDVELPVQMQVSECLWLDLNGHNITHKVSAQEGEKAQAGKTHNTRVFSLGAYAYLSITDSTETPGTVSRDLSQLTQAQQNAITNYGLIMILNGEYATGVLYDGVLDSTGMVAGGGGIFSNQTSTAVFRMYGGTLRGAVSNGGAIAYNRGTIELYGGLVTGGVTKTATGNSPGLHVVTYNGIPGKVILGGTARIEDNKRAGGDEVNIYYYYGTDPAENFIIRENFTGKAGIYVANQSPGKVMGICENPNITAKNLTLNGNDSYDIVPESGKLILRERKMAAVINGSSVTAYETLEKAVAAYPGGDAVLQLLHDNRETVTMPADANLDLAGWNLAGQVSLDGGLFVMDSATDDYTVEDVAGYGTVPEMDGIAPMPGYLMTTGTDGLSFHRFYMDTVAVTLRPSVAGLYFQSRFGGDEHVKSMVKSYGVAMGAGHKPNYAPGTYTAFDGSTWVTGADTDNLRQGTLLKDVLKNTNSDSENATNAETIIYGHTYAELTDGTRYVGNLVSLTFRSALEGDEQIAGAEKLWDQLNDIQKCGLTELYTAYETLMCGWNIPNIKTGK